jgi:cytochrome bd-type quinol oxidase subunit 2
MNLIYKLPKLLRWILLPFASVVGWFLVNILAKLASKIIMFLSSPGGWSENFFEYVLIPGIAGFCAVYIAMIFAPKHKKFVGYATAFLWVGFAGALAFFNIMLKEWPALLSSITTMVGCTFAIYEPPSEEEQSDERSPIY